MNTINPSLGLTDDFFADKPSDAAATHAPVLSRKGGSAMAAIEALRRSQWLHGSHEESHEPWWQAMGLVLHALRWKGGVAQLSDALPRESRQEGVDDMLNALAALGYVAYPLSIRHVARWQEVSFPLIALQRVDAGAEPQPLIVTGYGSRDGHWRVAVQGANGTVEEHEQPYEAARIEQVLGLQDSAELHDSSEEFARTQTGISWMQHTMRRFRGLFLHMVVVSLVVGGLTIAVPLFVMMVYDLVIDSHSLATLTDATTLLMQLLLGVALAMTAEAALRLGLMRSLAWFGARMQVLVGTALMGRFLSLPPSLTERASAADQLSRIRAFDSMRDFISGSQMLATLELPWCVALLLVIGVLGGQMVLAPLLGIGLFGVLAYAIRRPLEYEMYSSARSSSERQQTAMDMLTRLPAMKYSGVAGALFGRYSAAVRKSMHTTLRINLMAAILEHSAHALTALVGLLTLVMGLFLIWEGELSVGGLVAIMILTWRLLGIVQANCVLQPRIHYLRTSAEQINRLMALKPEDADYQHEVPEQGLQGGVECQGVVLRYSRSGEYVLRGLSFTAKPGELVAVMGQSGAGKSSLLKVLAGLYPPQAGSIRVDGENIRQYIPRNLRQHMVYMPQQPDFFFGTIAENLRLVAPAATDAELREALALAGAVDEVSALPEGLATQIGIGQMQLPLSLAHRLNLARIYLQSHRLMLLDELPYDVLNSPSGEQLYQTLKHSRGKRTVIYVTHRMDFAELADQLVWLRQDAPPMVGAPQHILAAMQQEQQP